MIYPIDIPLEVSQVLGFTHGERINALVVDAISAQPGAGPHLSVPQAGEAMAVLKEFMFANVYTNPIAKGEESKAQDMLKMLFGYYQKNPDELPGRLPGDPPGGGGGPGGVRLYRRDDRPLRGERVHPAVHPHGMGREVGLFPQIGIKSRDSGHQ